MHNGALRDIKFIINQYETVYHQPIGTSLLYYEPIGNNLPSAKRKQLISANSLLFTISQYEREEEEYEAAYTVT